MTRVAPLPSDLVANNAQAQLQQIVDHTSAAMFVKDLDGRFLFVNREFERMKGMPVAAIVGRLDGDLFPASGGGASPQRSPGRGRAASDRFRGDCGDRTGNPHLPVA